MKRLTLITMALLFSFVMGTFQLLGQSTPSPTATTQPLMPSLNPDELAFTEYVKANSETAFLEILNRFKNPKFPSEKFMELVSKEYRQHPYLEPFMVPGQVMEPSIYFEIAELSNDKPKTEELYLNKILQLQDDLTKDLVVGSNPIPIKEEAYLYMMDLYRETQKREKLCEAAERILDGFPNKPFQVTHWGYYGFTRPEALLVKYKTCDLPMGQKVTMLGEVLEKYGDENYQEHAGSGALYGDVAITYIRNMSRSKTFARSKTFSFFKGLLRNKFIQKNYGYEINMILGDSLFVSQGSELNDKIKTEARHYYQAALAGPIVGGGSELEKVQKGAAGDFSWYENSDLSSDDSVFDPVGLPSYNFRPIAHFNYYPESWTKK